MRRVRISYLVDYPEYIPQLAQRPFEEWDSIRGEKTPDARIKKLQAHLNRDKLPIAWVAHANGRPLGTAALRMHGREEYRLFICSHSISRRGIHVWAGQYLASASGTSDPGT
jgi:hypothetical protein